MSARYCARFSRPRNANREIDRLARSLAQGAGSGLAQPVGEPSRRRTHEIVLSQFASVLLDENPFHEIPLDVLGGDDGGASFTLERSDRQRHILQVLVSQGDALGRDDLVAQPERADLCRPLYGGTVSVFKDSDSIARGEDLDGRRSRLQRTLVEERNS